MSRIFITIILLMGTAVIGILYLRPEWSTFGVLRSEVQDLQETSGEFDSLIQNRDALLNEINSISQVDLERIDRAIAQGPQSSTFLVSLEALARKNGLILRRIDLASVATSESKSSQPRPTAVGVVKQGPFNELPFNLSVIGSYEAFKGFLADLEKNLRLIDVGETAFSAVGGNTFEFNIKAITYYQ